MQLESDLLTELAISQCNIKNIDQLCLKNLQILVIHQNPGFQIRNLAKFNNLKELDLSQNILNDISCLQPLTQLTRLCLRENKIHDISVLQYLTNLRELNVSSNFELVITPVQYCKRLTKLDMSSTNIRNIEALQSLINLEDLNLSFNIFIDLSPIMDMQKLKKLNASWTEVINFQVLPSLTQLKELDISFSENKDRHMTHFQYMIQLTKLSMYSNKLQSTQVLSQLYVNLKQLDISDNMNVDIESLQNLTSLTHLTMFKCGIKSLIPIQLNWKNYNFKIMKQQVCLHQRI
ncbi:leucine-rich_repeat domain-containing protein [Hexamita inflata]|uniref:Leucine-rich repeat domain-containing protein n=1 Tax=Hexamita inflata TaxID=28002 RepID=A0AA86NUZ2_9EUKA|nr:leucine-rich repeat domain-containing protein [Hexamita inflata]